MRIRHLATAAVASIAVGAFACGSGNGNSSGGSGNALTCSWLNGSNCFKTMIAAAMSCLPPANAQGTLSADGKTCSYSDGHVVAFAQPVTLPPSGSQTSNFAVTDNGVTCLSWAQPSTGNFTVKTSAGTFRQTTTGAVISMICPDGTTFSTSGPSGDLALISCDGGGANENPGLGGTVSSAHAVSVLLDGTGAGGEPTLFTCSTM
jgi:hypothetical protein